MRNGKTIRDRLDALGIKFLDADEAIHDLLDAYERNFKMADTKNGELRQNLFSVTVGFITYHEFKYGDSGQVGCEIINTKSAERVLMLSEREAANFHQVMRTVLLSRQQG